MGCFSPDPPQAPNPAQITRDSLQAQVDLAPQQYAAESNPGYGQPAYTALQLQNLQTLLTGRPAGTQTVNTPTTTQGYRNTQTGEFVNQLPAGYTIDPRSGTITGSGGVNTRGADGAQLPGSSLYVPWTQQGNTTSQVATAAQPGLIDLYGQIAPQLNAQQAAANTASRTADIGDVTNLGPQARAAILAANPDNARLLASLNAQANQGLDAGDQLDPTQLRAVQQASRAASAAAGIGGSNQALADEITKNYLAGQALKAQRQQFASGVIGLNQSVVGDPFQQILGRTSGATGAAAAAGSAATGDVNAAGPSLYNPNAFMNLYSGYAQNLNQSNIGAAANNAAIAGSVIGAVGKAI